MNIDKAIACQQVKLEAIHNVVHDIRKKPNLTELERHLITSVEELSLGYREALEQLSNIYK